MNTRAALVALSAAGALFFVGACDTPEDPDTATPAPVSTTTAPPSSTPPAPSTSASKSAPASAEPDDSDDPEGDTGLARCQTIMGAIRDGKVPMPVDRDAAYYAAVKKDFQQSRYADVKDAGVAFVDDYRAALVAGGKNPDSEQLSKSATKLLQACQDRM